MFDGEASRTLDRYWLLTSEGPGEGGGVGVHVGQTARMLADRGVAVTVLVHESGRLDPASAFHDGYRLIRFGERGLDRRPIPHANLSGPLRASREAAHVAGELIAAEGPPDVIECHDYAALAHDLLKARLMAPERDWPRVVLTAHRPHLHCLQTDGAGRHEHTAAFLGERERWCYAAADAVFAPCRFILEPLRALRFPLERAEVVFNPYAPPAAVLPSALGPEALELSRRLHTADEPVLVFAKLQRQKGVPDLLASLQALHAEGETPPAWLFGRDAGLSGTAGTALEDFGRRHALLFASGRLRYFGGYGAGDLAALCAGHPVAALPYREDCLPYAFIEAVAAGALPLTDPNGGQLELLAPELRERHSADARHPDSWRDKARALMALSPLERAGLSARLKAEVLGRADPKRVFAEKMGRLACVTPRHRTNAYPFVEEGTRVFAPLASDERAHLVEALPQRGRLREVRRAGPPPQPHPDLVSVIVPFFEMQDFVEETVASIEAQGHAEVELIVVDDGSPSPAARAALDRLMAGRRFPTRLLRKTNGGLSDARNAGARLARGDYLYFLDADDLIHPSTLARSLALLKRYGNVAYVGAGLKEFGDSEDEWAVHDVDGPYLAFHNLQICAFLVRASAWLRHGVNDPELRFGMEDYDSHLGLFEAGARGIAIPEPLFSYRKRPGSMSRGFDAEATGFLYRRIWANHPTLLHRFGPELVGLYAENGHGAATPSVCERATAHRALFRREAADLCAIADGLEREASTARLSLALRGRCDPGGAEWDYTTARLLLALDQEAAFARQLLRSAVAAGPANGWFRLYAMVAELRDGRLAAADALWSDGFADFVRREAGAVGWIAALEAVKGFPHVACALSARLAERAGVEVGCDDDLSLADTGSDEWAPLRAALAALMQAGRLRRGGREAETAVKAAALALLSPQTTAALMARWRTIWLASGLIDGEAPARPTFWGGSAPAYLQPPSRPAADPLERADQAGWAALARARRQPPLDQLKAGVRRLGLVQRSPAAASHTASMT